MDILKSVLLKVVIKSVTKEKNIILGKYCLLVHTFLPNVKKKINKMTTPSKPLLQNVSNQSWWANFPIIVNVDSAPLPK